MADIKDKIRENLRKTYPDMSDRDMDKSVDRFIRNIDKMLPTPNSKMNGTVKKAGGGMMNKSLKPVDKKKNPGLAKLPKGVRNKMGFMKNGGEAKKFPDLSGDGKVTMKDVLMGRGVIKKKNGGMVLEIGLRPATAKENKMAKKMMSKKPKKMANGGMARGTGAAVTGKGFKGIF